MNGLLQGDHEGVEIDQGFACPEHAWFFGLDRVETSDLFYEVDVFGLEIDCHFVLVFLY